MWIIALRIVAILLALAIGVSYSVPNGVARTAALVAIPVLIVAFIEIRKRANKVPDDEDAPWEG